jgi:acyl-CoA synthetase (AMP-forming)/AMP-acid ligase II
MRRELDAVPDPPAAIRIPEVTLPDFVLEQAEARGERRAVVDAVTGEALSYRQLAVAVREVRAGLVARGVQAGDVVALCVPNSIEFCLGWFAALAAGAAVTTLNPVCTEEELIGQLRQVRARWLVSTAVLFEEKVGRCARAAGIAESFVVSTPGGVVAGAISFESLRLGVDGGWPSIEVSPSDAAFLPCSSGTTGPPKAVVLSHRNLVASLCQMRLVHRVSSNDVVLAVLPLFHIFGLQVTLNLGLLEGATVVLLPRFEVAAFLGAVQKHRVTRVEVVPPMILGLARSDLLAAYDLSSLRVLTSGAAPLAADLARTVAARLGCRVKQGYGMTELGGGTHIGPDSGPDRPDCIGPAVPGVECRIVDPVTAEDLGPGEAGELLIRSPGMMSGYLDNLAATAATINTEGWLHTGDIATVDADGWFRVTDRIKELIKCNAHQVAPAELEELLLQHPAVADAAVVRSPDARAGEVPKAFVVLSAPASAEELIAWMAERVAPYKRIRRIEFIDAIPKSPSGKILRRILMEREQSPVIVAR